MTFLLDLLTLNSSAGGLILEQEPFYVQRMVHKLEIEIIFNDISFLRDITLPTTQPLPLPPLTRSSLFRGLTVL